MLPEYPKFLRQVYDEWGCDRVVHIGDLVDWNSISYHPKHSSLANPDKELKQARKQVAKLYKEFPEADWLIGNHDALPRRKNIDAMIPDAILRDENDLWGVPNWRVHERFTDLIIDGVIYRHGDKGRGGSVNAAYLNSSAEHSSLVQGHFHAQAGVICQTSQQGTLFGLQVGCGMDWKHPNMEYAKKFAHKPNLGCGVVYQGEEAHFVPMVK